LEGAAIRIATTRKDNEEGDCNVLTIAWAAPSPYRRREIIQGTSAGSSSARPLPTSARLVLLKALRKAHRWLDELLTEPTKTIESIAARESKTERSIRMTLSLAFLAPDLVKAAIEGRLPRGFGLTRLIDLPTAWSDQWAALGLKAPARI
jgi:site-specific DNA recombinase